MKCSRKYYIITLVTAIIIICCWNLVNKKNKPVFLAAYFAWIKVQDEQTKKPLDFDVEWNIESLTTLSKGSEPVIIVNKDDLSKVVFLIGIYLEEGVELTISSDGYASQKIIIDAQSGGIATKTPGYDVTYILLEK